MEGFSVLRELSRSSKHSLFYSMSKKYSTNLHEYKIELKDLYTELEFIEKQIEENETEEICTQEFELIQKINELERKIEFESISSIIFSGMFLEAYIYDYGARRLGDNFIKEHIDKLDPLSKIAIITQLVLGKPFPKQRDIYGRLKNLIKGRNNLVHNKSAKIDLANFTDFIEKRDKELFDLLKRGIEANNTINDFLLVMVDLDSNERFQVDQLI